MISREALRLAPSSSSLLAATMAVIVMKKYAFAIVLLALAAIAAFTTLTLESSNRMAPTSDGVEARRTGAVADASAVPRTAGSGAGPSAGSGPAPGRVAVDHGAGPNLPRGIRVIARQEGTGTPIARVGVTVLPLDGRHPDLHARRQSTDRAGATQFDDLAAGRYGIYTDRTARPWTAVVEPPAATVTPAAGEGATIDLGQLLNGEQLQVGSGTPITIQFDMGGVLDAGAVGLTTTRSVSRITDPQTGEITMLGGPLLVSAPDCRISSALPNREPAAVIDLSDGMALVELEIDAGRTMAGIVVDNADTPVAGAEIWVVRDGGRTAFVVGTSARDGTFRIDDVEAGVGMFARAAGFVSSPVLESAAEGAVTLRLGAPAPVVTGRVTDLRGLPIASARVRVGNPDDDARRIQSPTDPDGRFSVPAPELGRVPVLVLATGFQPWLGEVEVGPGAEPDILVQLIPGAIIAGRVIGPDGLPREGVTVRAEADDVPTTDVRSGADGVFRLECVTPGATLLVVDEGDDHRAANVPVVAVAGVTQEVDLDLPRFGRISGSVVDAGGQPLRRVTVRAHSQNLAIPIATGRTNAAGEFALETIPGESYDIDVFPEPGRGATLQFRMNGGSNSFVLANSDDDEVAPAGRRAIACDWLGSVPADREGLIIRLGLDLVPSAHLRGRVLRPDATPLAGSIRVHIDGGYRDVSLDEAGRFAIGPLVPGVIRFEVVPEDETLAGVDLPVAALRATERIDVGDVFVRAK